VIVIGVLEKQYEKQLIELFVRSGLEFSEEEPVPTDTVAGWQAVDDGRLVGGCVLALREGEYIIDGIAVESEYRDLDIGSRLLEKALDEARSRGGKEAYLVARAPGFFGKHGFEAIERDDGPLFFECFTCSQYNRTCFPKVMRIKLTNRDHQR